MELRRVNGYDLITVYVCQTLYDQFSKKRRIKTENSRVAYIKL